MSSKHYDIAIVGGSLSARIAAALLAKQGSKVLFLRYQEATASAWFHSSLFLEKLLGILGGRSCFVAQKPIQVLSRKARVTLDNDIPLDLELNREFGPDGPALCRWLESLRIRGNQLENLLWENGGLPWPSFKTTTGFKLLSIRRKVNWAELDAAVTNAMAQLPAKTIDFVTDLLQGLAVKRVDELTLAQAALLWAQAIRPENLKEPDFSDLLAKRFDQFHGLKENLDDLEQIHFTGSRWTGGSLKGGREFTASTFLLGNAHWVERFKAGKVAALPTPHAPIGHTTSDLTGQLSPLLATRVICGGEMPLRLAIEEESSQRLGLVLSAGELTEAQLRKQLEPVLPFAKYALSATATAPASPSAPSTPQQRQQLRRLALRIGSNLYCADSNVLLPEMGASGAALLGWTLAGNLVNNRKPGTE